MTPLRHRAGSAPCLLRGSRQASKYPLKIGQGRGLHRKRYKIRAETDRLLKKLQRALKLLLFKPLDSGIPCLRFIPLSPHAACKAVTSCKEGQSFPVCMPGRAGVPEQGEKRSPREGAPRGFSAGLGSSGWETLSPCLGELAARSSHEMKVKTEAQTFLKPGPELLKLFPEWEFLHYQNVPLKQQTGTC